MHNILVVGAGRIGVYIASLLASTQDYQIHLADVAASQIELSIDSHPVTLPVVALDVSDEAACKAFIQEHQITALISCLPYFLNLKCAELCKALNVHYFDLTEDVEVTRGIQQLAQNAKSVFVPQCGLAPGFVSIAANDLMQGFDSLQDVFLRVGALPVNCENALKYAFTWSLDGLINQYCNPCTVIEDGQLKSIHALEGLTQITLDGINYEAFNTSGGIGTLAESYQGKVKNMDYKSIRYPGHCEKMRFLLWDLKLNTQRDVLKSILSRAIPSTRSDVVVIDINVTGTHQGQLLEKNYVKKIYPTKQFGHEWTAIQVATASSACAVVDLVLQDKAPQGFLKQEQISIKDFLQNRFGRIYH